jgi:hypothetical protein
MKGYARLRVSQSNQHIYPLLLSLTFPTPSVVLLVSLRCSRVSWVSCRRQDNPRSASSNGVPPELAVLGFRGISAPTGLTGGCSRSDLSTWGFAGEDRLRSACASAFVCWSDLCQQIQLAHMHVQTRGQIKEKEDYGISAGPRHMWGIWLVILAELSLLTAKSLISKDFMKGNWNPCVLIFLFSSNFGCHAI